MGHVGRVVTVRKSLPLFCWPGGEGVFARFGFFGGLEGPVTFCQKPQPLPPHQTGHLLHG
jgi:hypothetical protein